MTTPTGAPLRDAIIFDVDGTLCDVRTVRYWVDGTYPAEKPRRNFDRFHEASADCPPYDQVKQLALQTQGMDLAVIVVTGRNAKWADLTADWIAANGIPCDELYTRGAKDQRSDQIVKADILLDIEQRYRVLLAIDDRLDIIEVWNAAGIPTASVNAEGEILPVVTPGDVDARVAELLSEGPAQASL